MNSEFCPDCLQEMSWNSESGSWECPVHGTKETPEREYIFGDYEQYKDDGVE